MYIWKIGSRVAHIWLEWGSWAPHPTSPQRCLLSNPSTLRVLKSFEYRRLQAEQTKMARNGL